MKEPSSPISIYILALEPSGDVLGAKLIAAFKRERPHGIDFSGVGGEAMQSAGFQTLFDPNDLAILGIFEVIPKAGLVIRRVREVLADIERVKPDVLITIDSWGFTGRVHKALAKRGNPVKRVRYVAPQVWAWRPGRAKQLALWIDHLLTLFPFEQPLFERHGLQTTWVGHPVTEEPDRVANGDRFRITYGIADGETILTVLPGSRKAEVRKLMPVFGETIARLRQKIPDLQIVIPTVGNVESDVRIWAQSLEGPVHIIMGNSDRDDAFAASRAALAASGTVTLELAKAGVPHVIAYKVNPFSAFVFRMLAHTKFVNLVNILLNTEIVPECLQDRCTDGVLTEYLEKLFADESTRARQKAGFQAALQQLKPEGESPSQRAARVVLDMIGGR
jgi:lipid-A-disaccharide synthase